jgi:hypothetical protein
VSSMTSVFPVHMSILSRHALMSTCILAAGTGVTFFNTRKYNCNKDRSFNKVFMFVFVDKQR